MFPKNPYEGHTIFINGMRVVFINGAWWKK